MDTYEEEELRKRQEKIIEDLDKLNERLDILSASLRPIGSTGVNTHNTPLPVVAIVGAGAAGISAAHELLEKGYQVVMIEAHGEMGGRARTVTKLGVPFDHGCQWLHDDLWQKAAKKFGVEVEIKNEEKTDYVFIDKKFSKEVFSSVTTFYDSLEKCLKAVREDQLEVAAEILARELAKIKEQFIKQEKINLERDYKERENFDKKIEEILQKEDFKAQAQEAFNKNQLQKEFHIQLMTNVRLKIIGELKVRNKSEHLSFLKSAKNPEFSSEQNIIAAAQNFYETHLSKYDLKFENEKDNFLMAAEEKVVENYAQNLKAAKKKVLEEPLKSWVEEEIEKLEKKIEEIYLPFSKALLGRFEESTEFEKFSVVDLRKVKREGDNKIARGGYGNLIRQCGEKLQSKYSQPKFKVYLNTAVEMIDYGTGKVIITTSSKGKDGHAGGFIADAVIVTASTAVLTSEKIKFNPVIPKVLKDFALLPLGNYKKIGISFTCNIFTKFKEQIVKKEEMVISIKDDIKDYRHFEIEDFNHEFITYCRDHEKPDWIWKIQMQLAGSNVVVLIASADFAKWLDTLSEKEAVAYALQHLSSMVGKDLVLENFDSNYSVTNWSNDPFVLGAYSYTAKGGENARERLMDTCLADKVFFAGEALWNDGYGSAHAALQSGCYAAEQVQKKLSEKTPQSGGQTKQGD